MSSSSAPSTPSPSKRRIKDEDFNEQKPSKSPKTASKSSSGGWTPEEDLALYRHMLQHGEGSAIDWKTVTDLVERVHGTSRTKNAVMLHWKYSLKKKLEEFIHPGCKSGQSSPKK